MADRPARLGMRRLAALGAAGLGAIAASPWITFAHGRVATVSRALMPWAGLTGLPLALVAGRHGHRRAATAGALTAVCTAAMCVPLMRRRRRVPSPATGPTLTILHANLLYTNRHVDAVWPRIEPLGVDVVTFSEYTPHHARILHDSAPSSGYPYRVEIPARRGAGTALWSRYPITTQPTTDTTHHTVVADVHGPGGTVRVLVVHTQSPLVHHDGWLDDLAKLGALHVDEPAVMTGDFNASWWHPELRRILADGWRDAHVATGRGLSCSWPTERWHRLFKWHPPFVRLDHALLSDDLDLVAVTDVDVPGSDHLGLVVRVAIPAPRAAP